MQSNSVLNWVAAQVVRMPASSVFPEAGNGVQPREAGRWPSLPTLSHMSVHRFPILSAPEDPLPVFPFWLTSLSHHLQVDV